MALDLFSPYLPFTPGATLTIDGRNNAVRSSDNVGRIMVGGGQTSNIVLHVSDQVNPRITVTTSNTAIFNDLALRPFTSSETSRMISYSNQPQLTVSTSNILVHKHLQPATHGTQRLGSIHEPRFKDLCLSSNGGIYINDTLLELTTSNSAELAVRHAQTSNYVPVAVKSVNLDDRIRLQVDSFGLPQFVDTSNVGLNLIPNVYSSNMRVGIGVPFPEATLDIEGTTRVSGDMTLTSGALSLLGQNVHILNSNLGVGTSNPQTRLDVTGDARVTGSITASNNLTVVGDVSVAGDASINGKVYFRNTFANLASLPTALSNAGMYAVTQDMKKAYFASPTGTWVEIFSSNSIPVATLSAPGIVQLDNTISSTSTTTAATASALKTTYDLASNAYYIASTSEGAAAVATAQAASNLAAQAITSADSATSTATSALAVANAKQSTQWSNQALVGLYTDRNVGINTTTPAYNLDVNGDINYTGTLLQNGNPVQYSQWSNSTDAQNNLYAPAKVAINTTTNPIYPLDVSGDINYTGVLRQNGTPVVYSQWREGSTSNDVVIGNKNIGIGISNPAYPLEVAGDINVTGGELRRNGLPLVSSPWVTNTNQDVHFPSTTTKVGIGLSNPHTALDVVGDIHATGKLLYTNSYATVADLPDAAVYKGVLVYVESTGMSYFSNGTVWRGIFNLEDIPQASLFQQGIVQLNSTVTSTSTSQAATASAVKQAYDLADSKESTQWTTAANGYDLYYMPARIGLGTSNPTEKLTVEGNIKVQRIFYNHEYSNVLELPDAGSNPGGVVTTSNEQQAFVSLAGQGWTPLATLSLSSNYLGVRTATPEYPLDVAGDIRYTGILRTSNGTPFKESPFTPGSNTQSELTQYILDTKIGVATSNPLYAVDVEGDINFTSNLRRNGTALQFWSTNTLTGALYYTDTAAVGVGTSNPGATLDVVGTVKVDGQTTLMSDVAVGGAMNVTGVTTLSNNLLVGGVTALSNNLIVGGAASLCNALVVAGDATLASNLSVAGEATLSSNLTVAGDATLSSNLTVLGDLDFGGILKQNGEPYISSQWTTAPGAKLFITGSNIGIGTSNPQYPLDVTGDGQVSGTLYVGSLDFGGQLLQNGTPYVSSQWTSGMGTLYLPSGYNVGINTSTPAYALDVSGDINMNGGTLRLNGEPYVSSQWTSGANLAYIVGSNVGIGTATPNYRLDVGGDINFTGTLYQNGVAYVAASGEGGGGGGGGTTTNTGWTANLANQPYTFANVGVGKSNPSFPIDVVGDINFTGLLRQNGAPYVSSQWTTSSNNKVYMVGGSNVGIGNTNPAYNLDVAGNINFTGAIYRNGVPFGDPSIWSLTSNADMFTTASNAKVGLGGQSAPAYTLDVTGDINVTGNVLQNGLPLPKQSIVTNLYAGGGVQALQPSSANFFWDQQAMLTASNASQGDYFSQDAVAIAGSNGDYMIVGAAAKNQAEIFVRSNMTWSRQVAFTGGAANELFGSTVDINPAGTLAAVGAPSGNKVYIYSRSNMTWTQLATLTVAGTTAYGGRLSLSGPDASNNSYLAISDRQHANNTGRVFIHNGNSSTWNSTPLATYTGEANGHLFGAALDFSADGGAYLAIGAPAAGSQGEGRTYIFNRNAGTGATATFALQTSNIAGDAVGEMCGASVAMDASGTRLVVGIPLNTNSQGVRAGALATFSRSGTTWTSQGRLVAADTVADDQLGTSVSMDLSGAFIAAGSPNETTSAGALSGGVSVFQFAGSAWSHLGKISPINGITNAGFGQSVAISSNAQYAAVGAARMNTVAAKTGAAYAFSRYGNPFAANASNNLTVVDSAAANGTVAMALQSGTRVGIGSSTAYSALTVTTPPTATHTGPGAYAGIHIQPTNAGTDPDKYTGITWSGTDSGNRNTHASIMVQGGGTYGSKMRFQTTNGWGTSFERMVIDHVGNVGIGTTSPSSLLHVAGNLLASLFYTTSGWVEFSTSWNTLRTMASEESGILSITSTRPGYAQVFIVLASTGVASCTSLIGAGFSARISGGSLQAMTTDNFTGSTWYYVRLR